MMFIMFVIFPIHESGYLIACITTVAYFSVGSLSRMIMVKHSVDTTSPKSLNLSRSWKNFKD